MDIELKEIDKATLKVGDIVCVARDVSCGWSSSFRHQRIYSAKVTRITPKRTKFFTDRFGEHDKKEIFMNVMVMLETKIIYLNHSSVYLTEYMS